MQEYDPLASPHLLSDKTYGGRIKLSAVEKRSVPYDFVILFKDSTMWKKRAKLDEHDNKLFLAINTPEMLRSITPNETLSISRTSKNGEVFTGTPADSCWMFLVRSGRINVYSLLAEKSINKKLASGIQYGDGGPIVKINRENVLRFVKNASPKVLSLIEADQRLKAVLRYNEENPD